jgi:hypothetical protein
MTRDQKRKARKEWRPLRIQITMFLERLPAGLAKKAGKHIDQIYTDLKKFWADA